MQKETNILFIKKLNEKPEIRMLEVLLYQRQKVISFWSNCRENKFASAIKNRIKVVVWNLRIHRGQRCGSLG